MHHLRGLAALIDRTDVVDVGQIAADLNLCAVEEALVLAEGVLLERDVLVKQRVDRQMEILLGCIAHFRNAALRLLQRQRGRVQEARLELGQRVLLHLARRHAPGRQFDQQIGKRQEQNGAGYIEQGVEVCDAALVDRRIPERETDCILNRINGDQKDDRTDQVKIEVHHRRAACVLRAAQRGQECRDTGADILAQDDRHCCRPADHARGGQRLQNTDRSGRGLDDRRDARADQHAQHRVGDRSEQLGKLRQVRQRGDRAFHHRHADEQNTKAGENICNIARAALFGQHHDNDARQHNQIRQIARLEQIHQQVAAAGAAVQAQDLRGDRGADIRTQDYANRLLERHDTGVDKTDHHDRRRRGRLDDHGDHKAHQQCLEHIAGHFFQCFFKF